MKAGGKVEAATDKGKMFKKFQKKA